MSQFLTVSEGELQQIYPEVSLFLSPTEQQQLNKLKEAYIAKYHYLKMDLGVFVSILISKQLGGNCHG